MKNRTISCKAQSLFKQVIRTVVNPWGKKDCTDTTNGSNLAMLNIKDRHELGSPTFWDNENEVIVLKGKAESETSYESLHY